VTVKQVCLACYCEGIVLFYLPGAWDGGLCEGCARHLYQREFTEHFGTEIRHVSDSDAAKAHAKS
jgi:hypothetical protein